MQVPWRLLRAGVDVDYLMDVYDLTVTTALLPQRQPLLETSLPVSRPTAIVIGESEAVSGPLERQYQQVHVTYNRYMYQRWYTRFTTKPQMIFNLCAISSVSESM